jgi:hypothetical protein
MLATSGGRGFFPYYCFSLEKRPFSDAIRRITFMAEFVMKN